MRHASVVALLALAALVVPAQSLAHANLKQATPGTQSRVDEAPTEVVLRFDQVVTTTPSSVGVVSAEGRQVSGPVVATDGGRSVRVALTGVRDGEAYTVRWRATGNDGHTASGVFTFGVGVEPPPPTEAYGATGPTWTDDAGGRTSSPSRCCSARSASGCSCCVGNRCRHGCRTGSIS